jgi:uncharacterized repeat protein (TIGR01451 family)
MQSLNLLVRSKKYLLLAAIAATAIVGSRFYLQNKTKAAFQTAPNGSAIEKKVVDSSGNDITAPVAGGSTVKWVINYQNSQSFKDKVEITDVINNGLTYVANSLTVPENWSKAFSNNSTASNYPDGDTNSAKKLQAIGTNVGVPALSKGTQIAPPLSQSVATTSLLGGDGFTPILYEKADGTLNIYAIYHHKESVSSTWNGFSAASDGFGINCVSQSGVICPGYPKALSSAVGVNALYTTYLPKYYQPGGKTGNKLFYSVQRQNDAGVACFDLLTGSGCSPVAYTVLDSSLPWTGFIDYNGVTPTYPAKVEGIEVVGNKLYMIGANSDGTITTMCMDVSTQVSCSGYPVDAPASAPKWTSYSSMDSSVNPNTSYTMEFIASHETIGTKTYWAVNYNGNWRNDANSTLANNDDIVLYCFDSATNAYCSTPFTIYNSGRNPTQNLFVLENKICFSLASVSGGPTNQCFDPNTLAPTVLTNNPFASIASNTTLAVTRAVEEYPLTVNGDDRLYFALRGNRYPTDSTSPVLPSTPNGWTLCWSKTNNALCSGFGSSGLQTWSGINTAGTGAGCVERGYTLLGFPSTSCTAGDQGIQNNAYSTINDVRYSTIDYGYNEINGCMYGLGDSGVLWSFDPSTGSYPCTKANNTVSISLDSTKYFCDGKARTLSWDKIIINNTSANTGLSYIATIYSDSTMTTTLMPNTSIPASGSLDIPGSISASNIYVKVEVSGASSGWTQPVKATVSLKSSDNATGPQICYQTVVANDCSITSANNTAKLPATSNNSGLGTDFSSDTVNINITPGASAPNCNFNLSLDKKLTSSSFNPGDTVTYDLKVSNTTGMDALAPKVTDTWPSQLEQSGIGWSCAANSGGATVASSCPGSSANGTINATSGSFDLNLGTLKAGQSITITLTGKIKADYDASTVSNRAEVFNTMSGAMADHSEESNPTCSPEIPMGDNNNTPCLSATTFDNADIASFTPKPYNLAIDKVLTTTKITKGGPIEYKVTVYNTKINNNSIGVDVTGSKLVEVFPDQIENSVAWSCVANSPATTGCPSPSSGSITYNSSDLSSSTLNLGTLKYGENITFTFTGTLKSTIDSSVTNIVNEARVVAPDNDELNPDCNKTPNPMNSSGIPCVLPTFDNVDTVNTPLSDKIDVEITKTHQPSIVSAGGEVKYIITVKNNGPATANSVTITDNVPDTVAVSSWECNMSNNEACEMPSPVSQNLVMNVKDMAAQDIVTIQITGRIKDGFVGTIENTGTVKADDQEETTYDNNTAKDVITIAAVTAPATPSLPIPSTGIKYPAMMLFGFGALLLWRRFAKNI